MLLRVKGIERRTFLEKISKHDSHKIYLTYIIKEYLILININHVLEAFTLSHKENKYVKP
jgi:hypothetical protein